VRVVILSHVRSGRRLDVWESRVLSGKQLRVLLGHPDLGHLFGSEGPSHARLVGGLRGLLGCESSLTLLDCASHVAVLPAVLHRG